MHYFCVIKRNYSLRDRFYFVHFLPRFPCVEEEKGQILGGGEKDFFCGCELSHNKVRSKRLPSPFSLLLSLLLFVLFPGAGVTTENVLFDSSRVKKIEELSGTKEESLSRRWNYFCRRKSEWPRFRYLAVKSSHKISSTSFNRFDKEGN